jgi:6-phospho-beta-glucosidase
MMSRGSGVGVKIVVVGAGSSYTVELFAELIRDSRQLDVDTVALVDLDPERIARISRVAQGLLDAAGSRIRIAPFTDLRTALEGADFVVPQIRVGGLAARKRDEELPMEFGLVGNETTGAGGFVCALRTVPVVVDIARVVERVAPDAWILNLSNPAGIVTEALLNHSSVRAMGFCNIPINTADAFARIVGVDAARVRLDSFGLNHLSWLRRAFVDGEDRLQPMIDQTTEPGAPLTALLDPHFSLDDFRALRLIPSWYVRFFYFTDVIYAEDRAASGTKADRDVSAEQRLSEIFATGSYTEEVREILASKGGAQYYDNVLASMAAIVHDQGAEIIADVRNEGAVPDLPRDACVEIPARVGAKRTEALPVGELPVAVRGLIQAVKAYEQLTIEAALTGNHDLAIQALVANPLVRSYSKARPFFDRVLQNERHSLPRFFGEAAPVPVAAR